MTRRSVIVRTRTAIRDFNRYTVGWPDISTSAFHQRSYETIYFRTACADDTLKCTAVVNDPCLSLMNTRTLLVRNSIGEGTTSKELLTLAGKSLFVLNYCIATSIDPWIDLTTFTIDNAMAQSYNSPTHES